MDVTKLNNPFVNCKLDDIATIPPGDVPELHEAALAQCYSAIAATRLSAASTSLIVVGEAGSGKSHMIAQLRGRLAEDSKVVLAAIRLGGASSGCLWRHVRQRLAVELLRPLPSADGQENGLLRILRNRFPKWIASDGSGSAVLDLIFGKPNAAENLRQQLDEFAKSEPGFDYNLRKVLPHFAKPDVTSLAQDWLRGAILNMEDYKTLGLPEKFLSDDEQERVARSVVISFLQLAGDRTTLFIFFDEVEAIQAGNQDAAVLRQLATLATDLLGESGSRVVATSIRPNLHVALAKAVEVSNLQKMTQFSAQIPPLDWEQAVRIVRARLDVESTCRNMRQQHPQDPDWPIGRKFLEETFAANRRTLTPRHLILACGVEFQRLQKGGAGNSAPTGTDAVSVTTKKEKVAVTEDELLRVWERQRKKFLEKPHSIQFENIFAIGLPWLVQLFASSLVRIQDRSPELGDINMVFQPRTSGKKAIGVSFCNHEPKQLWHRLDRLIAQWQKVKARLLSCLVILRAEKSPTTPVSAKKLDKLRAIGATVVLVDIHQLAEMAAFQAMLTATLEGEMTRSGKPLEATDFDDWTREHLSESIKNLLQVLFENELESKVAKALNNKKKKALPTAKK